MYNAFGLSVLLVTVLFCLCAANCTGPCVTAASNCLLCSHEPPNRTLVARVVSAKIVGVSELWEDFIGGFLSTNHRTRFSTGAQLVRIISALYRPEAKSGLSSRLTTKQHLLSLGGPEADWPQPSVTPLLFAVERNASRIRCLSV